MDKTGSLNGQNGKLEWTKREVSWTKREVGMKGEAADKEGAFLKAPPRIPCLIS